MVDDAAVSLKGRGVRLGHPDGGFSGPPHLFMLPDARVVGVPGSAGEAAVVHEEQAGAQQEHEKHRNPMTLHKTETQARCRQIEPCCTGAQVRAGEGATSHHHPHPHPLHPHPHNFLWFMSRAIKTKKKKEKSSYRFHLRAQAWSWHWQDVTLLMMILN